MSLPLALLTRLVETKPEDAWAEAANYAWNLCSQPIVSSTAVTEITRRDRELGSIDLVLGTSLWDLWHAFPGKVQRTADMLAEKWSRERQGCAVLILDGLSLREVPWLLGGATKRGYKVRDACATAAPLPSETTPFAAAMGFGQRAALENNALARSTTTRLPGGHTECTNLPWTDAARLITADPRWVLWHHWPDNRVHDLSVAGQGISKLAEEVAAQLESDSFWLLVSRLCQGRRLLITSDHGYAASGLFGDVPEDHGRYLKDTFRSGRTAAVSGTQASAAFVPPVDLTIGNHRYVLGRRKWKSPGGYPTLCHGGLSILEVLVPFIEITRSE